MASIKIEGLPEAALVEGPGPIDNDPIGIQADEMFARQLDTGFAGEIRALLHDPEAGLAGRDPEEALGGVAEAMPMLGELKDRYLAQAIGPRQRTILEPLIDSRLDRATGDLGRIAQQATSVLDDRIVAERIANLQQEAALAWHDPAHLRALGRTAVGELRYQGERRGWDEAQTDTTVRRGLSDLYAGAVERAIGQDSDRAAELYEHARNVIQPERQQIVERKMERAREERGVSDVMGSLAVPDDPTRQPDLDDYQARAAELTPPDASPEVRGQVNRMVQVEHAYADQAWQAARGRAAIAAVDWLGKNPATRLLAMPAELRDRLSPEQTERLDQAAINGGRVVTDHDLYELLDRQAIYEPKVFAGLDLSQHRLSLDDQDYQRFVGFQKGLADGRPDVAFQRYDLGRSALDEGFEKANFDPGGPEARAGRTVLGKTLGAFEAIQGRPATLEDIEHIAGEIVRRALPPTTRGFDDELRTARIVNDEPVLSEGDTQTAQQENLVPEPAAKRGVAPTVELPPGTHRKDGPGQPVILPDGSRIPDRYSPTGYLMAPIDNLEPVAAKGRQAGTIYRSLLTKPGGGGGAALAYLGLTMRRFLGQGGAFDYQREKSNEDASGFTQLRQFRNVSNVNVGLFAQQAGMSLHDVLTIAGEYAAKHSSNADPTQPYGLNTQTKEFIEVGYEIGQSGAFGPATADR
jgi:hypothetical protein